MRIRFENTHDWRIKFDFIQFVSPFLIWLLAWSFIEDITSIKIGYWGLAILPASWVIHAKWLHALYDQASAFCFTRFTLKVPISFREAKALVHFTENNFSPDPLMYIASMPVMERKNEFFKKIVDEA
jgi:hypothetical protein